MTAEKWIACALLMGVGAPQIASSALAESLHPGAPEAAQGLNLLNLPSTSLECPVRSGVGGGNQRYRYLYKLGGDGAGDWTITLSAGAVEFEAYGHYGLKEADRERFRQRIDSKSARPGTLYLSPTFNLRTTDYQCAHVVLLSEGAKAPSLTIVAKIVGQQPTSPLSIGGEKPGAKANFIPAADVWKECAAGECLGEFAMLDTEGRNGARRDMASIWSATTGNAARATPLDDRRRRFGEEKLRPALEASVHLTLVKFFWNEAEQRHVFCDSGRGDRNCVSRCSGFFVTDRIIATNAHCVRGVEEGRRWRSILYAWRRPAEGGAHERHRSPDLQRLTPIFAGRPNIDDFALLWTENAGAPAPPSRIPPLSRGGIPGNNSELTIVGYPGQRLDGANQTPLVLSFDDHCRAIRPVQEPSGVLNFAHLCDTDGASSGSPVYSRDFDEIVGLHFAGFIFKPDPARPEYSRCGERADQAGEWKKCFNTALPVQTIRQSLGEQMKAIEDAGTNIASACATSQVLQRSPLCWDPLPDAPLADAALAARAYEALRDSGLHRDD